MLPRGILLTSALLGNVAAHGATVYPPPRNAIDSNEAPWSGDVPDPVPFEPWCPIPDATAPIGPNGALSGVNGQACYWFSNGCSIDCATCDQDTRGPIPNVVCKNASDPNEMCRRKMQSKHCLKSGAKATLPMHARTVNTDAPEGSDTDFYYYSPWRKPGSAGVLDPCGMAGGRLAEGGGYGATYQTTANARQGDFGVSLKPSPSGTVWRAGDVVEVSWALQANHGGGYQWRLCPAPANGEQLTEECFQQMPLAFVGSQSMRWNGDNATREWITGVYVSEGTVPNGSTWAMNPVPRNDTANTGESFEPKCDEVPGCANIPSGGQSPSCKCSGMWGPYNLEIVDMVLLPESLAAGEYVLGWRWDCEESNQIWQSCSDVTVIAQ